MSKLKSENTKRRSFSHIMKTYWQFYLLLLLPLAYIAVFNYSPLYGLQIAFKDYSTRDGIWGSEWVGFEQFERFFRGGIDGTAFRIIGNTIWLSVYSLVAGFLPPIILAVSLNYVRVLKFKKTVQMISYAPHFISTVVMVGIINQFLSRTGFVNNIIVMMGGSHINFFADAAFFDDLYVWSGIWQHVGFSAIIFLGILTSVDAQLHEAATVDGANVLHRIWHIDIPVIIPTAITLLIMNTGRVLSIGFEKVFLMQNDINRQVSEIISTYVYSQSFETSLPDFSYTTAIGLFESVVGFILIVAVNRIAKKVSNGGIF